MFGTARLQAAEIENYVGSNFSTSDAQGHIIMMRNLDLLLNTTVNILQERLYLPGAPEIVSFLQV
jgi:hypothetical protein